MKTYQISMTIGLVVLLIFNIPITWADKKTAVIIEGTGSSVVTLGGAIWHYFFNEDAPGLRLEFVFNGKNLKDDKFDTQDFVDELKDRGFSGKDIQLVQEKISEIIERFLRNKVKTVFSFLIKKTGKQITINTKLLRNYLIAKEFDEKFDTAIRPFENNNEDISILSDLDRFSSTVDYYRQTDIDGIYGEMTTLEESPY